VNVGPIDPCGGIALATFTVPPPVNLGSETLTVTVPADDVNSNNSNSVPVDVTLDQYSFKYPGTIEAGGVGVNGSTASLVGKFLTTGPTAVTKVTLEFDAATGQTYRVAIYGPSGANPLDPPLYLDAADRTVAAPGPVTITLPSPVAVGSAFFAGIQQTGTVNASLGFDDETPIRVGRFYGSIPTGTAWFDFAPGTDFKLNVGVVIDPCAGGVAPATTATSAPTTSAIPRSVARTSRRPRATTTTRAPRTPAHRASAASTTRSTATTATRAPTTAASRRRSSRTPAPCPTGATGRSSCRRQGASTSAPRTSTRSSTACLRARRSSSAPRTATSSAMARRARLRESVTSRRTRAATFRAAISAAARSARIRR